MIQLTF